MRLELLRGDEHEEWAALYAAGAFTPEEIVLFKDHLATGCEICVSRLRDFEAVAADLAIAASSEPAASLRSKVLARILEEARPAITPPRVFSCKRPDCWSCAPKKYLGREFRFRA